MLINRMIVVLVLLAVQIGQSQARPFDGEDIYSCWKYSKKSENPQFVDTTVHICFAANGKMIGWTLEYNDGFEWQKMYALSGDRLLEWDPDSDIKPPIVRTCKLNIELETLTLSECDDKSSDMTFEKDKNMNPADAGQ